MKQKFSVAIALIAGLVIGATADKIAWTVSFDGQPSKMQPLVDKEATLMPVSIPAPPGTSEWQVVLVNNPTNHTMQVTRTPIKVPKKRGGDPCDKCSMTGQCQNCYPVGSGLNYAGTVCYYCNGTAKCWHCGGTKVK